MFRRKEEMDAENQDNEVQGSLLAGSASETVNVISPQQATGYGSGSASSAKPAMNGSVGADPASAPSAANNASYGNGSNPFARQTGDASRNAANSASPATPAQQYSPFRQTSASNDSAVARPRPVTATTPAAPAASAAAATAASPASEPARPVSAFGGTGNAAGNTSSTGGTFGSGSKESRRVLTVGTDILLKGEITTCDRLVIEGKVDATVSEVHTLELLESGTFKGNAQVECAEISGSFDGDLNVKGRLVIFSSGRVSGKISYGEIEIERGGEITGEIKTTEQASGSANMRVRKERSKESEAA